MEQPSLNKLYRTIKPNMSFNEFATQYNEQKNAAGGINNDAAIKEFNNSIGGVVVDFWDKTKTNATHFVEEKLGTHLTEKEQAEYVKLPHNECGVAPCPKTEEQIAYMKRKRTKKIIYTTAAVAAVIGVSIFIYKKVIL